MIIGKVLAQRALITPDREALIFRDRTFTYRQLNERANRMANALLGLGVKPGDRVGLLMSNSNEFLETYFASAKIGAVLVPLNTRLAPSELDFILDDCTVSFFLYGQAFEEKVSEMAYPRRLRHRVSTGRSPGADTLDYETLIQQAGAEEPTVRVNEKDLHVIMYTSGTTGNPKGAMLTHANMYAAGIDLAIGLHYRYPDRCLLLAPFFHSGAITPFLGHLLRGITTVIVASFEPPEVLELIEEYQIRLMLGVTAMLKMLLQVPDIDSRNLDSWKLAILPGSPVPYPVIKEAYERFGVLCQNLWGLTEMCGPGSFMNEEDILHKPESAGKPYFNVDIRIVGPEGEDLPAGQIGEIVARGPNMMLGYWNQAEATRETIKDGWLYTGDLGRFDEDGYLYVVDRLKDMILSGGENVYPAEIEKVVRQLPGVLDVSVIGVPDEKWGEVPKAFIERREDTPLTSDDIIRHCRTRLAGYKVPKLVAFIKALPRTPSGKVLKRNLRSLTSTVVPTPSNPA